MRSSSPCRGGQTAPVPYIADLGYTYQLRATRADGAISDSGEQNFDIHKETAIALPAPPDPVTPAEGATIEAGQTVSAVGRGILEHVFEPATPGAPAVRIVGTSMDTTLPDLEALAVDSPSILDDDGARQHLGGRRQALSPGRHLRAAPARLPVTAPRGRRRIEAHERRRLG